MAPRRETLQVRVDGTVWHRIKAYAKRHSIPYARFIRAAIEAIPWDDDTVTPVVLKIPNKVAADPVALRAWLDGAATEIEEYFDGQ